MAAHATSRDVLLVSGGDDGAIAILRVSPQLRIGAETLSASTSIEGRDVVDQESHTGVPVLLPRAHASAVTACALFTHGEDIYVLTAGNDEWVRLWRVSINSPSSSSSSPSPSNQGQVQGEDGVEFADADAVSVTRLTRLKTSVADVSSMAILHADEEAARVLVCGVGMEVIRVEYENEENGVVIGA